MTVALRYDFDLPADGFSALVALLWALYPDPADWPDGGVVVLPGGREIKIEVAW